MHFHQAMHAGRGYEKGDILMYVRSRGALTHIFINLTKGKEVTTSNPPTDRVTFKRLDYTNNN